MKPENAWDAAHLEGARQVEEFVQALAERGDAFAEEARRHGDNAYVLVEYLANTFPKLPRQATERDVWLFLFDYSITQGPFSGATARLVPQSVRLFFEFLAARERLPEARYIREACSLEEFYLHRLAACEEIARAAHHAKGDPEQVEKALAAWWMELDHRMWERGLVPDATLAGGDERWAEDMGPLEAAAFDAVCVVLNRRARELRQQGASGQVRDRELLAAQREFMTRRNPAIGTSPLAAVLHEREARAEGTTP